MRKITYDEAVMMMAFDGATNITMRIEANAAEYTVPALREYAASGAEFFVPGEEPKKKAKSKKDDLDELMEDLTAKPKKKPKELDHGKIVALYKAGWSAHKIADEMRCADATVYYHLDKDGLRNKPNESI